MDTGNDAIRLGQFSDPFHHLHHGGQLFLCSAALLARSLQTHTLHLIGRQKVKRTLNQPDILSIIAGLPEIEADRIGAVFIGNSLKPLEIVGK